MHHDCSKYLLLKFLLNLQSTHGYNLINSATNVFKIITVAAACRTVYFLLLSPLTSFLQKSSGRAWGRCQIYSPPHVADTLATPLQMNKQFKLINNFYYCQPGEGALSSKSCYNNLLDISGVWLCMCVYVYVLWVCACACLCMCMSVFHVNVYACVWAHMCAYFILIGWQAYRGDQIHWKNSPT